MVKITFHGGTYLYVMANPTMTISWKGWTASQPQMGPAMPRSPFRRQPGSSVLHWGYTDFLQREMPSMLSVYSTSLQGNCSSRIAQNISFELSFEWDIMLHISIISLRSKWPF